MNDEALARLGAADIARAVQHGECAAADVCAAVLARVDRVNPALNAIVGLDAGAARDEAAAVDRRVAAGEVLPLAGVPYTVKDNLWVGGRQVSQGSRLFADFVAPRDAWAVARLRALGAVMLGITNCSEFACKGVTVNPRYGATRNPWNTALTPGGSSGGAAAAVAAGLGPLALCTDAGGSTRRPAAHCGIVGMKPTAGIVAQPWGFDEPNFGISVTGQLARTVGDCALMLDLLVGHDARDAYSVPFPGPHDFVRDVRDGPRPGLRIAWSSDLGCGFAIDADVAAVLQAVVERLAAGGFAIETAAPAWPPGTAEYPLLAVQQAGLAAFFGDEPAERRALVDPDLLAQIDAGRQWTGADIARRLLGRERIAAALAGFFERYDLLLCPTAPVVAWPVELPGPPEIGGRPAGPRGHAVFTPLFNYCGVPACSVPAGLVRGLPVGLQVVGPRFADGAVLAMAGAIERMPGLALAPPRV